MALCINICKAVFNQQKVIVFIFYAVGRIKTKMVALNTEKRIHAIKSAIHDNGIRYFFSSFDI